MNRKKFSATTLKALNHYVYALIDPRDMSIFYVGKASGNNRAFDHLKAQPGESNKLQRISDIRTCLEEPIVEIIRYGLKTSDEALEVEAAVIDALGLENLTNAVRGHGIKKGRLTAEEIERLHGSKPVLVSAISEPSMVFYIHNSYSPTASEQEVYDCVRQFWHNVAKDKRESLSHSTALGVVEGVVVRAYKIAGWFQAGTTFSTRKFSGGSAGNKWEFVGQINNDHPLLGRVLIGHDGKPIPAARNGYEYFPKGKANNYK